MTDAVSAAREGTSRALAGLDRTARRIADGAPDPGALPQAMVDLSQLEVAVKANTAVIRTADGMVGTLLDALA